MKTIIAGSRTIENYRLVEEATKNCGWKPSIVVTGCAKGVDTLGEKWADEHGVIVERFPAEWDKYGKKAGFIRNERMADNAQALILIWDGESKGSAMMLSIAKKKGLKIFEVKLDY